MGYNTSVIVMNDALGDIEHEPDFGKKLSRAIMAVAGHHDRGMLDVAARGHCNAASVIETHHADSTTLVSFGGNTGVKHLTTYGWNHHEPAMQLRMCQEWASQMGYRLVKKHVVGKVRAP